MSVLQTALHAPKWKSLLVMTRYHRPCHAPPRASRKIIALGMCDFICNSAVRSNSLHQAGDRRGIISKPTRDVKSQKASSQTHHLQPHISLQAEDSHRE